MLTMMTNSLRYISAVLAVVFVGFLQILSFSSYFALGSTSFPYPGPAILLIGLFGIVAFPIAVAGDLAMWKSIVNPIHSDLPGKQVISILLPIVFAFLVFVNSMASF